jgi:mono/diheme cytochrome c family protein
VHRGYSSVRTYGLILGCLITLSGSVIAADFNAGKATATTQCAQCHEADDWKGETAASLESLIKDIVAGKVKHKKALQLSESDAANIALYWSRAGK